ncbi:MAG: LamG domain-containing protein, partial [Candidatus Micrarchaeota archaeon]
NTSKDTGSNESQDLVYMDTINLNLTNQTINETDIQEGNGTSVQPFDDTENITNTTESEEITEINDTETNTFEKEIIVENECVQEALNEDLARTNYEMPEHDGNYKEFNLEVVFYDVTTCYVADTCQDDCNTLNDYRDGSEIMEFERGTLMTLEKEKADSYGYGTDHGVKKCVSSYFSEDAKETLERYVNDMSDLLYSWTKGRMRIVPHFHSIDADMGSETLAEEATITNYQTGKNPSPEKFIHYAKEAELDTGNMDLFVAFVNPYPKTGSENDGLLVQSYVGETSGTFNGISMVKLSGMKSSDEVSDKNWIVPVLIHEIIHTFNIGHYSVSGFEDVYGIQNAESHPDYDAESNQKPHCTSTEHYTDDLPNQFTYFPDSYNWLDPMWNEQPFEQYEDDKVSYCLEGSESYPSINPLNSSDHYEDIADLNEHSKYYKFVFEAHYQDEFAQGLYTSYCKNHRFDGESLDFSENFEYQTDNGGGCLNNYYQCASDGLCFSLDFENCYPHDNVNGLPIKNEGVITKNDIDKGKVGSFSGESQLLVSGADYFADSDEMTIEFEIKLNDTDTFSPIITNIDRYYVYVQDGKLKVILQDWRVWIVNSETTERKIESNIDLEPNTWYDIKMTLENGICRIYVDGEEVGNNQDNPFQGKFMYQETSDFRSHVYVGYNKGYVVGYDSWLEGQLKDLKFYERVV